MRRQRSRTRKGSPQTNRGSSLLVNSWKMAELSLTTTFRRSPLSIWFSVLGEECRFLSRLSPERPSPLRLSHLTQLKCEGKDPGQGRDPPRPTEADLCWQTVGRWPNSLRLQHSEGINSSSCSPP